MAGRAFRFAGFLLPRAHTDIRQILTLSIYQQAYTFKNNAKVE
jgi:hypothetical protein